MSYVEAGHGTTVAALLVSWRTDRGFVWRLSHVVVVVVIVLVILIIIRRLIIIAVVVVVIVVDVVVVVEGLVVALES